jgi:hypothetical protein
MSCRAADATDELDRLTQSLFRPGVPVREDEPGEDEMLNELKNRSTSRSRRALAEGKAAISM